MSSVGNSAVVAVTIAERDPQPLVVRPADHAVQHRPDSGSHWSSKRCAERLEVQLRRGTLPGAGLRLAAPITRGTSISRPSPTYLRISTAATVQGLI